MILIPDLQITVILTPRAGSTALKEAILRTYPRAIMLYRHMEADGVPQAYDRWPKHGLVRHPVERLWSVYKYTREMSKHRNSAVFADYIRECEESAKRDFSDWIVNNRHVFASGGYGTYDTGDYHPFYSVKHALPENLKSAWVYLRPDLGTRIWQFDELAAFARFLKVELTKTNASSEEPIPAISREAWNHIHRVHCWDLDVVTDHRLRKNRRPDRALAS